MAEASVAEPSAPEVGQGESAVASSEVQPETWIPAGSVSTTLLQEASTTLPYPAASVLHRFRRAQDPDEQYDALIAAGETLAVTVSVTLAALLRARDGAQNGAATPDTGPDRDLGSLCRELSSRPMTFGAWITWLRRLASHTADHAELSSLLNEVLHDKAGQPGLVTSLDWIRKERNRAAHGDVPRSAPEYALRAEQNSRYLEAAVRSSAFLRGFPWLYTKKLFYRPRSGVFEISARIVMGSHPDFDTNKYRFTSPVANESFYLLDAGRPVQLTPLVAYGFCLACNSEELCYTARVSKHDGSATLHSFERGHEIQDRELGSEIRALIPS
jgi:hypothetical protein